jgi:DNA invertase Pin-like site-specific DNA recombinase
MTTCTAYYRVSTLQQNASGLGLEAQRAAIEQYCKGAGLEICASFIEVASGKRADRPELAKAIAHCLSNGSKLLVATLDRLSRNPNFLSSLIESKLDFCAVDRPNATPDAMMAEAADAQNEANRTGQRTKDALAALKRRGVKLGSAREGAWEGREDRRQAGLALAGPLGNIARHEQAKAKIADLLPTIASMRAAGKLYREIATALNADGATTGLGNPWNEMTVRGVWVRFCNEKTPPKTTG